MRRINLMGMLSIALVSMAAEQQNEVVVVRGNMHIGTTVNASRTSEVTNLSFETNDARLGSNSGNTYADLTDYQHSDGQLVYGAALNVSMKENHQLGVVVEGKQDWNQRTGTRTEQIKDKNGAQISGVSGGYSYPQDRTNDILAGINYRYSVPRPGDTLQIAYRYHWDNTSSGLEQQVNERTDWALYATNSLQRQVSKQTHRAWAEYSCRITKGHILDIGTAYERRQIDGHTLQEWDAQTRLNTDYRHLTQYGALYAHYRLALGPVKARIGLEYRATKMQQRWLHDAIPSATLRYQVDSVHALTGGYRMLLIRPEYFHLDTNKIRDAYTLSFGQDALVGTHVHVTNLTYHMTLPKVRFTTDVRYITASDGLNALWMEKNNVRTYTWGNEGIRHAVSMTPSVDGQLGTHTRLYAAATVLWDERIAKAIQMSNANWGISTQVRLEQQLPYTMSLVLYGNYAYHNTLDLYSYEGHGGRIGLDWNIAFLRQHNLTLKVGYAGCFQPNIHITQGGWTGWLTYPKRYANQAQVMLGYRF